MNHLSVNHLSVNHLSVNYLSVNHCCDTCMQRASESVTHGPHGIFSGVSIGRIVYHLPPLNHLSVNHLSVNHLSVNHCCDTCMQRASESVTHGPHGIFSSVSWTDRLPMHPFIEASPLFLRPA